MVHLLVQAVYRKVVGQPYYTVRRASVEFGPPPAAVHAAELARYTDAQLMQVWGPEFVAELRTRQQVGAAR